VCEVSKGSDSINEYPFCNPFSFDNQKNTGKLYVSSNASGSNLLPEYR